MPYKDKERDRAWHRDKMRERRTVTPVVTPTVQPKLYNPTEHRVGDTVLIQQGKRQVTVTIPELDADGQPIPEM